MTLLRPVCFAASFAFIAVLLTGCDLETQLAPRLQGQINELRVQTGEMKAELDALADSIEDLRVAQVEHEIKILVQSFSRVAFLEPEKTSHAIVRFDLGLVTVKLVDVKPYANGSKVTLQFGNVLAAPINGLNATVEWGRIDEKGNPASEPSGSRNLTLTETLRTGAWTSTSVVLEGLPATELGFVRIKDVAHSDIALSR